MYVYIPVIEITAGILIFLFAMGTIGSVVATVMTVDNQRWRSSGCRNSAMSQKYFTYYICCVLPVYLCPDFFEKETMAPHRILINWAVLAATWWIGVPLLVYVTYRYFIEESQRKQYA